VGIIEGGKEIRSESGFFATMRAQQGPFAPFEPSPLFRTPDLLIS
jgi:hypothetical protein